MREKNDYGILPVGKNFEYLDNESQWERKNNWKDLGKMFVKEFHVFIHKMGLNLEFKNLRHI